MRQFKIAMLTLGAAACGNPDSSDKFHPDAPVVAATLTYDGANATDAAGKLAHGERMSWILGCKGCHGDNLQGMNVTEPDPEVGDMNAPNLTLLMARYSDAELERVIRRGVPKDGREFWFMPSESFQYASDADVSALLVYLRTLKPAGKQLPPIKKGPLFEKDIREGKYTHARGMVERFRASRPVDLGERHAFGRYIAMTVCTECHNSELHGYQDFTPDLDIAGAYTEAELEALLTTGKGKAKPYLGLMSKTGKERFSKFTPRERTAIIAYVKARAERLK